MVPIYVYLYMISIIHADKYIYTIYDIYNIYIYLLNYLSVSFPVKFKCHKDRNIC